VKSYLMHKVFTPIFYINHCYEGTYQSTAIVIYPLYLIDTNIASPPTGQEDADLISYGQR
jgi:hypothetical protein